MKNIFYNLICIIVFTLVFTTMNSGCKSSTPSPNGDNNTGEPSSNPDGGTNKDKFVATGILKKLHLIKGIYIDSFNTDWRLHINLSKNNAYPEIIVKASRENLTQACSLFKNITVNKNLLFSDEIEGEQEFIKINKNSEIEGFNEFNIKKIRNSENSYKFTQLDLLLHVHVVDHAITSDAKSNIDVDSFEKLVTDCGLKDKSDALKQDEETPTT